MNEKILKDKIIEVARRYGWLVHHDLPAMDRKGNWRTHVQGDVGFPDLCMVHPSGRMVVAEFKTKVGRLSVEQKAWLAGFEAAGIEAYVWRPIDLPAVIALLGRKGVTVL